jgi:hypothetical protein
VGDESGLAFFIFNLQNIGMAGVDPFNGDLVAGLKVIAPARFKFDSVCWQGAMQLWRGDSANFLLLSLCVYVGDHIWFSVKFYWSRH